MLIRFIQTFSSTREVFHAGNDYDVPNADAIRYINDGFARKTAEPARAEAPAAANPSPLKPGEQLGIDPTKPAAEPVPPEIPAPPADNPAGFMHANGTVQPSTGFTTSNPDASVSPPSDGPSPIATNTGLEAVTAQGKPAHTANKKGK